MICFVFLLFTSPCFPLLCFAGKVCYKTFSRLANADFKRPFLISAALDPHPLDFTGPGPQDKSFNLGGTPKQLPQGGHTQTPGSPAANAAEPTANKQG